MVVVVICLFVVVVLCVCALACFSFQITRIYLGRYVIGSGPSNTVLNILVSNLVSLVTLPHARQIPPIKL